MVDPHAHMTRARDLNLENGRAPVEYYISPEIFEREKDAIFRRHWLILGREEEIVGSGDYIVRDVPPLKASVIIIRGRDGVVRAFYNMCSHRGSALTCQRNGNARAFRCPYHAWTFGDDGTLLAIPSEADFSHVDKPQNGLAPITLEIWNGFIFVNFAEQPELTLRDFLAGFDELFDDFPFHDFSFCQSASDEADCNWKNLVNAFGEGYHVAVLHRNTLRPQVVPSDNPHLHWLDVRHFGPHSTGTVQRNFDWVPSTPVLGWVIQQMLPTGMPDAEAIAAGAVTDAHPSINRINVANFGIETMSVFPNTSILPSTNGYLFLTFWPLSHNRMRADIRLYSRQRPTTRREEFASAHILASTRDIVTEDLAMSRIQQIGLESGGKKYQHFGENEPVLRLFMRAYEACLAGDGPADASPSAEVLANENLRAPSARSINPLK